MDTVKITAEGTVICDGCGNDVPEESARLDLLDDGHGCIEERWTCRPCRLRAELGE